MGRITKLEAEALRVSSMLMRKREQLEKQKTRVAQIELDIKALEQRQRTLPAV